MLTVTAVWGWTFVLVKDAVTQYPTLPFLQIRFALALVVMAVVLAGQRFGLVQAMARPSGRLRSWATKSRP